MKVQPAFVLGCAIVVCFLCLLGVRPVQAATNDSLEALIHDARFDDITASEGAPGKDVLLEMCRVTAEKLGIATAESDLHLLIRATIPRVSSENMRSWLRESVSKTIPNERVSDALALLRNPKVHDVLTREQLAIAGAPDETSKQFKDNPENFKDASRIRLCGELEKKQNTSAMVIKGAAVFVRSFLESANLAMPAQSRFTRKEIEDVVAAYEGSLSNREALAQNRKRIVSDIMYGYAHISNHELQDFVDLWNGDAGRLLNKAAQEFYFHIAERGGKVYGAEIARQLATLVP